MVHAFLRIANCELLFTNERPYLSISHANKQTAQDKRENKNLIQFCSIVLSIISIRNEQKNHCYVVYAMRHPSDE